MITYTLAPSGGVSFEFTSDVPVQAGDTITVGARNYTVLKVAHHVDDTRRSMARVTRRTLITR